MKPFSRGIPLMRKLNGLHTLFLLLAIVRLTPAANILVVDDDNRYNNETQIYGALNNLGISYDSYDCSSSLASPDSSTLSAYDLVIWFTGDDNTALYFWNGTDTENPHVINYLNQGGKLWMLGLDFLFDLYAGAPDTFSSGDFIYDYAGISSYDAQSYTDDGGLGVDFLLQADMAISEQDTIDWNTSSGILRYVDGCTLTDAAISHYVMAPESYPLSGLSVVQSQVAENYVVLSSWINIYYFSSSTLRDAWVGDVLDWFDLPQELGSVSLIAPADESSYLARDLEDTGLNFRWSSDSADSYTLTFFQNGVAIDSISALTDTICNLSTTDLSVLMSGADYAVFTWQVTAYAGEQMVNSDIYTFTVSNQLNRILFVDDDDYQNYEFSLKESLDRDGFVYDVFNTALHSSSPDAATLANYDLVIWYTGSDGLDQYFWSGNDSENPALADYLDNGGRLWINGLDVLYDRYGAAPDVFAPGSFVYDYMGLKSYTAQSYSNDDGSLGNPLLYRATDSELSTIDTLRWRFATAHYLDAVVGNQRSFTDYVMGPDDYILNGRANVTHHVGDGFIVLNTLFNYNHIDADSNRDVLTRDIINWFNAVATGAVPTIVQLNAPTDAFALSLMETDSSDIVFDWSAASDPDGEIRGYRFCLGFSESNSADIILSNQTQLTYTVNERFLYELIPSNQDTVQLFWQVLAYDDHDNISASNAQSFIVSRGGDSGPSPFALVSPADNTLLRVHENNLVDYSFSWGLSIDPDGETVIYNLEFWGSAGSAVFTRTTDQNNLNISSEDLLSLFTEGSAVDLTWTVIASDGEFETMANQPHNLSLLHALPQVMTILVVDDDDRFNNETSVYTALADNYLEYSSFDCAAAGAAPGLTDLTPFDLVIWLTGDDSVGLYFWNGIDQDNLAVSEYLDQGGRMWLVGLELLYDRYGSPPYYFSPGDMMYDYFGTAAYRSQSYLDDDSQGLSMLLRVPGSQVSDMDTLRWGTTSGILRYADGCGLGQGAQADMVFGPSGYQLGGMANSYHATNGNYITMSSWFNPYYLTSNSIRADWIGDVVNWFQTTLSPESLTPTGLTLPAAGSSIGLNSLTGSFEFSWEAVESEAPVSYQLILTSDAEDVVPQIINTSSTSSLVDAEDLFDLTGTGTDQLELAWHVIALTPMAGYSVSETRIHEFIEGINEAPTNFSLLLPVTNDTLRIETAEAEHSFSWSSAMDPEGDSITYRFIVIGLTDTLMDVMTQDTLLTFSSEELIGLMNGTQSMVTFWKVYATDGEFWVGATPRLLTIENHVVGLADLEMPSEFKLYQNYPNPFNPTTSLRYDLPEKSDVLLSIYDISGRLIQEYHPGEQVAGVYHLTWNGQDYYGNPVSTGVYLYRLQAGNYSRVVKMLFLK